MKKIYSFIFAVFLLVAPTSIVFANESMDQVDDDQIISEEVEQTIDQLDVLTDEIESSDIEQNNQIINNLKQKLKVKVKNESQIVSNAVETADITKDIKQNKLC